MSTETADGQILDQTRRLILRDDLRRLTGCLLAEVRVTRVRWQDGLHWCVLALAVHQGQPFRRREVPLAAGILHHNIAILIRDAFPHANWSRAQNYNVTSGILREHVVRLPASLRGEDR